MSSEQRAELRRMADALPTIIFHSNTLWFGTTHEHIEHLDADPVAAEAEDWPTGPGYDVEPDLGAFIEAASAQVLPLLDAIDRVIALHQESDIGDGVKFCSYDHGDTTPETWPCDILLAIEGGP